MKILTLNFLTCATKACKAQLSSTATGAPDSFNTNSPFPLHPREAELEQVELDFNPQFIKNVLPRVDWEAMRVVLSELGIALPSKPAAPTSIRAAQAEAEDTAMAIDAPMAPVTPEGEVSGEEQDDEEYLRALHTILIETNILTGKLLCARCGHEYAIKEGIANFLLPPHLV